MPKFTDICRDLLICVVIYRYMPKFTDRCRDLLIDAVIYRYMLKFADICRDLWKYAVISTICDFWKTHLILEVCLRYILPSRAYMKVHKFSFSQKHISEALKIPLKISAGMCYDITFTNHIYIQLHNSKQISRE